MAIVASWFVRQRCYLVHLVYPVYLATQPAPPSW